MNRGFVKPETILKVSPCILLWSFKGVLVSARIEENGGV